jgi:peroxiredoxin family protein
MPAPQTDPATAAATATANAKSMAIIVSKGTLDWAYPPFILATTAAAMDVKVSMFFTFYGLPLLLKKIDAQISPLGKPDMAMPMLGMHMRMPNALAVLPGMNAMATRMMKNLIRKKGVASIAELRAAAVESEIELIGCQMTMDLFEFKKKDMIPGIKIAGAATFMETALRSDINLFI